MSEFSFTSYLIEAMRSHVSILMQNGLMLGTLLWRGNWCNITTSLGYAFTFAAFLRRKYSFNKPTVSVRAVIEPAIFRILPDGKASCIFCGCWYLYFLIKFCLIILIKIICFFLLFYFQIRFFSRSKNAILYTYYVSLLKYQQSLQVATFFHRKCNISSLY